jgi:prephenate dehydrogenase
MRIAILGGAGRMGKLLVRDLASRNNSLVVSDPDTAHIKKLKEKRCIELADTNRQAVSDADTVIVAVPMKMTGAVIREVVSDMKTGAILCEISSVKHRVHEILKDLGRKDISPLCVHPLFGEGASCIAKRLALIPVFDRAREEEMTAGLFPEYEICVVSLEEHDRIMAMTISLPYFVNLIVTSVFQKENLARLQMLGGTTFKMQLVLAGSVMFNSCILHEDLHRHNPYTIGVLKEFQAEVETALMNLLNEGADFRKFCRRIKAGLREALNVRQKYEEMYHFLAFLEERNSELAP